MFVTGGVVSGIGKGITVASLGALMKARGINITLCKMDPYVNVDAGTMNPFQHGEVFVTDDGAETDLDLGHYERFTDVTLSKNNNMTTGKIFQSVIQKERNGEYLGKTVQLIPHVTNEIINHIKNLGKQSKADLAIIEIGGTVGDIEAEVFIEAIRQFRRVVGRNKVAYLHVTKIDYIYPSDEPKTKPTQTAVNILRSRGILPDFLVVRCKEELTKSLREKIALFADLPIESVIAAPNASSLYEIPLTVEESGLPEMICKFFGIKNRQPDLKDWKDIADRVKTHKTELNIGMVGKYTDHTDAYLSVVESLYHGGIASDAKINIISIDSEKLTYDSPVLKKLDGMVVPGGFGIRGIEGKISAIKFARDNKLPFLGLCLGLQCATIEFARNVCGLKKANSSEFAKTKEPVIDILPEQVKILAKGGTMRLGNYAANLVKGSLVARLYGATKVNERHRHRFEVNPKYHKILEQNGLVISGFSPNGRLAEFIELPQKIHPFFVATQAHPEFKSRPHKPAPLFKGFIKATLAHQNNIG